MEPTATLVTSFFVVYFCYTDSSQNFNPPDEPLPLVFSVVLAARVTCLAPIFSLFFLFFPQIFNQSLPLAFSVASARDPPRLAPYNFFQF